jgi:thioredoxin 1
MNRSFGIVPLASAFLVFALAFSSCAASNDINSVLDKARREGKAVMLELGSVGCIPCEEMKPVMQKLSAQYGKKLTVHFIDVRVDRQAAFRFGVNMIPTQVFLDRDGREFHRHAGYYSFEEIQAVLKKAGF